MVMEKQRKIEASPFWGGGFFSSEQKSKQFLRRGPLRSGKKLGQFATRTTAYGVVNNFFINCIVAAKELWENGEQHRQDARSPDTDWNNMVDESQGHGCDWARIGPGPGLRGTEMFFVPRSASQILSEEKKSKITRLAEMFQKRYAEKKFFV